MNVPKISKKDLLAKISLFLDKLREKEPDRDSQEFIELRSFVDDVNDVLVHIDKDFKPLYYDDVRFKYQGMGRFFDKLWFVAAMLFVFIGFFARACAFNARKTNVDGHYSNLILDYSVYVLLVLGLFIVIKHFIINKSGKIRYEDSYIDHLSGMKELIMKMSDDDYYMLSFELGVKTL
ncbi:MAG: hypothetical protein MJZ66_04565 [Bacteroidales bacterium]|nr:hypothetical protein [Bacteroidales bacterium]